MDVTTLMAMDWFPQLAEDVRRELERLATERPDEQAVLATELTALEDQMKGWAQSLAKPDLSVSVRAAIEAEWEKAFARKQEIECRRAQDCARHRVADQLLDPALIVEQLNRLEQVLAANNPTLGNIELSLHIDQITCHADSRIVLRTCKLGGLPETVELLADESKKVTSPLPKAAAIARHHAKPRRRTRLRTNELSIDGASVKAAAHFAADPNRFAGLSDAFFWTDEFVLPQASIPSWSAKHAAEVAALRVGGMTMEQLANHFGKTIPTIRKALRLAAGKDDALTKLPKKMPRRCWALDHAIEVAKLKAQGLSTIEIARTCGKSDTTIRAALKLAQSLAPPPPRAVGTAVSVQSAVAGSTQSTADGHDEGAVHGHGQHGADSANLQ